LPNITFHFNSFPFFFLFIALQVIADTLAEFGDNIDAAIKHLNNLQLSAPGTSKQHAIQEQQRLGILGPPLPAAVTTVAAAADNATTAPAAAAAAQADEKPANVSTSATPVAPPPPSRTAEEWIELLVQQMSAATNVVDAKQRASQVLRAFEQAVMQHSDQQLGDISRENALLKRAVAIQNSRLQELLAKEAEANELKSTLETAKNRIHSLEVQNYSLQLHLKRATDAQQEGTLTPGRNNPDVF
jgi:hypothetical protein